MGVVRRYHGHPAHRVQPQPRTILEKFKDIKYENIKDYIITILLIIAALTVVIFGLLSK